MTGEGETQVLTSSRGEAASMKGERELEETLADRKLAKPGELAPHVTSMRSRSESAREAFRGEEMQQGGEGEAFAFRELRIGTPRSEKRGEGEAKPREKGGELARRARRLRANCRRSEEERRRSHEREGERRREKEREGERRRGGSASEERPAKLSHELLELLEALLELSLQSFAPVCDHAQLESALAKL
jgi:hypothetical protein